MSGEEIGVRGTNKATSTQSILITGAPGWLSRCSAALDLGVMSSSATLGAEMTKINKSIKKTKQKQKAY